MRLLGSFIIRRVDWTVSTSTFKYIILAPSGDCCISKVLRELKIKVNEKFTSEIYWDFKLYLSASVNSHRNNNI